jgi:general secretion pathway protein N
MNTRVASLATLVLTCVCGFFALLAVLQIFGFGTGYGWLGDSEDNPASVNTVAAIDREPFKLPNENTFSDVQRRPPFNEDRKPTQFADPAPDKPALPPVALNITLNGVILTPDVHLVMLTDKTKNTAVMIKEGMPLPGDQGGWTLMTIKPRSAIFNDGNSDVEVELSSAPSPPPSKTPPPQPAPPPTAAAAANAYVPPGTPPIARAPGAPGEAKVDDLQHRIEERRKQMRDEAAKQAQQKGSQ